MLLGSVLARLTLLRGVLTVLAGLTLLRHVLARLGRRVRGVLRRRPLLRVPAGRWRLAFVAHVLPFVVAVACACPVSGAPASRWHDQPPTAPERKRAASLADALVTGTDVLARHVSPKSMDHIVARCTV